MRIFDTKIQELKYEVLKEVAKRTFDGDLGDLYYEIPRQIVPGPKPTMRCCVFKERAVIEERIKLAIGGDKSNPNIIEVLDNACAACPVHSFFVTDVCRGCITHQCMDNCPVQAISVIDKKAVIDRGKCIECGKCTKSCPYGAIMEMTRPCVRSCKAGAISIDENKKAVIDNDKCVMCGACVYQCPFGAISDKSFLTDAIHILKDSDFSKKYRVYAVIAPAIVSQFKYAKIEQIVTGIQKLGFYQVMEAALGADITLSKEVKEAEEKGVITTSCCPSFVMYIEKQFPQLAKYISDSPSPMVEMARLIKSEHPDAKVIFIGPCTSKKYEFQLEKTGGAVDCVISFEELQALLDSREIDVENLEETPLNNASFYGRIFAKSGGISQGVKDIATKDFHPVALNGLEECKIGLLKLNKGLLPNQFIEGMACVGGCINGALCLHHGPKNAVDVDNYGKEAAQHSIENSVMLYQVVEEKKKNKK